MFQHKILIGNREISNNSKTFIIAEAGVNHNGNIDIAKKLIDAAAASGVDAVIFQTFKTEKLILKNVEKAPYQKKTSNEEESQFDMLKKLELTKEQTKELLEYCNYKNILFLSTPFDKESLDLLDEIGVKAFKISATDLTNIQFLRYVAKKQKPIIISAGMCYMEEVERALNAIEPINQKVILLQCTSNYPILNDEANIGIVEVFKNKFDMLVGYSDHSEGVGASPYAVALGAKVIEKHFTIDKNMSGPDQKASITPEELKKLVEQIRIVEEYIGNNIKMPTQSEQFTRKALQKCFVASKKIKKGEIFTDENIIAKRTNGEGISAIYFDEIIGKISKYDFNEDEVIRV